MKVNRFLVTAGLALVLGFTSITPSAHAAIPSEINGKPVASLAPMLEKVIPGVVNIATESTTIVQRDPFFDDPVFRHFFNLPNQPEQQKRRSQSLGSGVIVDADKGYILTNNHVIARADKITVTLNNGKQYTAKLIGTDKESDIAVIQIPAEKLIAVSMSNSDQLRVGDFVVAIGNPFGLGQTVTSGIVSALGRSGLGIEGYEDFIQTDASINPGNSGGALVNLRGELIGINTAILSRSGGNIGIGFAIPINMARNIMNQLIQNGEIRRGRLGVYIQDLTPDLARAFGIPPRKGAVIAQVSPGSAAEKAGIRTGDIVTHVDGKEISGSSSLRNAIGMLPIGRNVKLDIIRDGRQRTITATIGEPHTSKEEAKVISKRLEGAVLGELEEDNPLYGKVDGIVVLNVENGSAAWMAGLRKGDIITSVNRVPVKHLKDLKKAISKDSNKLLLNIRRGNGALYLLLQ